MKNTSANTGYVKLSRKILDWEHWSNPNVAVVFLTLLLVANSKESVYRGMKCCRGETFITLDRLCALTHRSRTTVNQCLKALVSSGEIKRVRMEQNLSKTLIVKYDEYQGVNGKDSTNCVLPQYNGHTTGSTPGALKQEYNNNTSSSSINENNNHMREAREVVDEMFNSGIIIENFGKNEGISADQCRQLADEVLNEWELTGKRHMSESDLRQHLLNHMRVKIRMGNLVNDDRDKRLKGLIHECQQFIDEGFPLQAVEQFYAYWTQPMNDRSNRMLFEGVNAWDTRTRFITFFKKHG